MPSALSLLPTMPKDRTRTLLPTSTTDFALPAYAAAASTSSYTLDDSPLAYTRLRRQSVLAPKAYLSETRLASPLQTSFTLQPSPKLVQSVKPSTRPGSAGSLAADPGSSSSSGSSTPAMSTEDESTQDVKVARAYRSPPRRSASAACDTQDSHSYPKRRLSFPVRSFTSPCYGADTAYRSNSPASPTFLQKRAGLSRTRSNQKPHSSVSLPQRTTILIHRDLSQTVVGIPKKLATKTTSLGKRRPATTRTMLCSTLLGAANPSI